MKRRLSAPLFRVMATLIVLLPLIAPKLSRAAGAALVGWSDVGLHEFDGTDVSVYSLMPPYNTIHAQLVVGGLLVTNPAGYTVSYQAVADATGSINSTSTGKGNFFTYAAELYGQALNPDRGLAGFGMPGPGNAPQTMLFDATQRCFTAVGIPITPYDDQGRKNPYPLMRLVASDGLGNTVASTDIVLPVSDEMDCRACHASGTETDARPMIGWAWDCDPERDYKLNVLRKHDDHFAGTASYSNVLALVGYNPAGLAETVVHDGRPVSCIRCHASNALPGSGAPGMRPFTQLMHSKHAYTSDPQSGVLLNNLNTSAACLRCHAGAQTHFQRSVHGHSIAASGAPAMQCQICHGTLTDVGAAGRKGWLEEPSCQSCHTGTATHNAGQLRYTSVFDTTGKVRQAVDATFATQTNTPAAGLALYQASQGHGGLSCAACHGSAHAELTSTEPNENVQSQELQGHAGILVECAACHPTVPNVANGGPHGLHPAGRTSFAGHGEGGVTAQCQACHGGSYLGTVLSHAQANRTLNLAGEAGASQLFWTGSQIGCYNCHAGPGGNGAGAAPAVASNASATTVGEAPVDIPLSATDPAGLALTYRVVSQPAHGTVSSSNNVATYFPEPGFVGADSFTFAAWNGDTDSGLGTVDLTVNAGACVLTASALAPTAAFPHASVPFRASATLRQCAGAISYDWDFGDGTPHAATPGACHLYPTAGDYTWTLTVTGGETNQVVSGVVTISPTLGPPLPLYLTSYGFMMLLSWIPDNVPVSVETSLDLSQPNSWTPIFDIPNFDGTYMNLWELVISDQQYFRLRRVP